eukprot:6211892-Pleurochrysis_carterae.AAC.3
MPPSIGFSPPANHVRRHNSSSDAGSISTAIATTASASTLFSTSVSILPILPPLSITIVPTPPLAPLLPQPPPPPPLPLSSPPPPPFPNLSPTPTPMPAQLPQPTPAASLPRASPPTQPLLLQPPPPPSISSSFVRLCLQPSHLLPHSHPKTATISTFTPNATSTSISTSFALTGTGGPCRDHDRGPGVSQALRPHGSQGSHSFRRGRAPR